MLESRSTETHNDYALANTFDASRVSRHLGVAAAVQVTPEAMDADAIEHVPEAGDVPDEQDLRLEPMLGTRAMSQDLLDIYMNEAVKTPLLTADQEVDLARSIEAGLYAQHLLDVHETAAETDITQNELRQLAQEGERAKAHMIAANLRLVLAVARHFTGKGLEYLDLVQEGNIGLMRAVEKFDYTQGFKFSTYATWWIRQSIKLGIANTGRTIRVPVHQLDFVNTVKRTRDELRQWAEGDEPTVEDIARAVDSPINKVAQALTLIDPIISLDKRVSRDRGELGDTTLLDLIDDGRVSEDNDGVGDEVVARLDVPALTKNLLNLLNPDELKAFAKHADLEVMGIDLDAEDIYKRMRAQLVGSAVAKLLHPANSYALNGYALPWVEDALCAQVGSMFFFVNKGGSVQEAKSICANCDARKECGDYAIENGIQSGIWGGMSPRYRAAIARGKVDD